MIMREALRFSRDLLAEDGIPDSRIEAEALLMHLLNKDRLHLYLDMGEELGPEEERDLSSLLTRRLQHEPIAYILGQREFFGIEMGVDRRVLIPRPETELLVEKTLEYLQSRFGSLSHPFLVADVGTGSGAIAVALARSLPNATIYAIDISSEALKVARTNFKRHNVAERILALEGDLLSPLPERVDVIVANLPYVAKPELANLCPEVREFEPRLALDGGEDGFSLIRRLLEEARGKLKKGGAIIIEIGFGQTGKAFDLADKSFHSAVKRVFPDLGGINRVLMVSEVS